MKLLLKVRELPLFLLLFLSLILAVAFPFSDVNRFFSVITYPLYIAWMYAISGRINELLPENLMFKMRYFSVACIISIIYFPAIVLIDSYNIYMSTESAVISAFIEIYFLFSAINLIYVFYRTGKMTARILNFKLQSNDHNALFYFFGYWFGFIGVWYILPKLRGVFESEVTPSIEK